MIARVAHESAGSVNTQRLRVSRSAARRAVFILQTAMSRIGIILLAPLLDFVEAYVARKVANVAGTALDALRHAVWRLLARPAAQAAAIGAVVPHTLVAASVRPVDAREVAGVIFTNGYFSKRVGRTNDAIGAAASRRVVQHAGIALLMEERVALKPALKTVAHGLAVLRLRARIARISAGFDAVIVNALASANVVTAAALRSALAVYAFHKAVFGRSRTSLARGAAALRRIRALALTVGRQITGDAGKRTFVSSA